MGLITHMRYTLPTMAKAQPIQPQTIQAIRAALGESQEQFAARVGCSQDQISRYERNGTPERMNNKVRANLQKLAKKYGSAQ
jgi:transcriptional regulator with XRE-family HTH domain